MATPRTEKRARHIHDNYYIGPARNSDILEIWAFSDKFSYYPGESIDLHVNTSADFWDLEIARDGHVYEKVFSIADQKGQLVETPEDCSVNGCAWPVSLKIEVGTDWKSGAYLFTLTGRQGEGNDQKRVEEHHLVIIKAGKEKPANDMLLICSTGTWMAYNCWGGSNSYEGITGPDKDQFSPVLSTQKPWTRGFCKLPNGAPRPVPETAPKPGEMVRYPYMEWAYAYGYSKKYASAGWASYERHFVIWAEEQGYAFDIATQHDLDQEADLLDCYKCVVFVGHDEYWSSSMRDQIERWTEQGGKLARFAGNFLWQIRIEEKGKRQICFKARAEDEDPVMGTEKQHLLTSGWDFPNVNRPGAKTFGVNGVKGIYAGLGNCVGRGPGGYTVYRPEHWVFDRCQLGFGDVLGAQSRIFGYEVDGVEYSIQDSLPVPTGEDGVSPDVEILGMGLCSILEANHQNWGEEYYIADHDLKGLLEKFPDEDRQEMESKMIRGNGAMIYWRKGKGEVFSAATCEWVMGLTRRDFQVEQVTRNVLNRFLST